MYPEIIQSLIEIFSNLTGVGEKTAQRYVLELVEWESDQLEQFSKQIAEIKTKLKKCKKCHNFTENDLCNICIDKNRNQDEICVVETVRDLIVIEKSGIYRGKYFVLEKLISIVDNVYPEDIHIQELVELCRENEIKEVIIALSLNVAGETTTQYISKKLALENIKTTRLASGIPIGTNIEFTDQLTLVSAFNGRK